MVIAIYGTLLAGAVAVPTSPLYSESELVQVWGDAEAWVVVCLSSLYRQVQGVRGRLPPLEHVVVTNIKEYFPQLTRVLFTLARESKEGHRVRLPHDGQTEWLQPHEHPKVLKVVAVGIPDEKWGETVKIYVVLKDGQVATASGIIAYCRERLARYKVPEYVEFRDDLPETVIGKVLRRKLREEEQATQAAKTAS